MQAALSECEGSIYMLPWQHKEVSAGIRVSFLEEVTSSWDCREGERKKLEIEAGVRGSGGAILRWHAIGTQRTELFLSCGLYRMDTQHLSAI